MWSLLRQLTAAVRINLDVLGDNGQRLSLRVDSSNAAAATVKWLPGLLDAHLRVAQSAELDVCAIKNGAPVKALPVILQPNAAFGAMTKQQQISAIASSFDHHRSLVERLELQFDPHFETALLVSSSITMAYARACGIFFDAEDRYVYFPDDLGPDPAHEYEQALALIARLPATVVETLPVAQAATQRALKDIGTRFRFYIARLQTPGSEPLNFMEHAELKTLLIYLARTMLPPNGQASDSSAIRRHMVALLADPTIAGPEAENILNKAAINPPTHQGSLSQHIKEGKRRYLAIRAVCLNDAQLLTPQIYEQICGSPAKCQEVAERLLKWEGMHPDLLAKVCGEAYLPNRLSASPKAVKAPT